MIAPTLHTDRLTLRAPRESDHAAMAVFGQSSRNAFVGGRLDAIGAWRALLAGIGHWTLRGYGYWAVVRRADQAFIGRVGVIKAYDDPEPELAYHLFDGFEGQGYATEAVLAARAHAQGVKCMAPLASFIDPANLASVALARRVGAVFEATMDRPDGSFHIYRHPAEAVRV